MCFIENNVSLNCELKNSYVSENKIHCQFTV